MVAAYVLLEDRIEPLLSLDGGKAIGGAHTGSGFVVQENGFVLTNRHVAATWETRGNLEPGRGVVGRFNQEGKFVPETFLENPAAAVDWVPSKSKFLGGKPLSGKIVEGRHDYLDVNLSQDQVADPGAPGSGIGYGRCGPH